LGGGVAAHLLSVCSSVSTDVVVATSRRETVTNELSRPRIVFVLPVPENGRRRMRQQSACSGGGAVTVPGGPCSKTKLSFSPNPAYSSNAEEAEWTERGRILIMVRTSIACICERLYRSLMIRLEASGSRRKLGVSCR
jgi:hypothetical protein